MTRFLDGPAKDVTLMLQRLPVYLRVVQGADGKWDALDQQDDKLRPDEAVCLYLLAKPPGQAFIDGSGFGGCYPIASYQFVVCQPPPIGHARLRQMGALV